MNGLDRLWYGRRPLAVLALLPLTALYCTLVTVRRFLYRRGLLRRHRLPVPVVVVGNLAVGGTGKTPLVAALARQLREAGWQPGLVARGYGGRARQWPQQVRPDSDPAVVGDEAVLLARLTGCPMAVGPDRVAAAQALVEHAGVDLVLSDDGLQHLALARDVEIVVVDGIRRHGNRLCLPAGPLREPLRRLRDVDLVVCNGPPGPGEVPMHTRIREAVPLTGGPARPLADFRGRRVHAVAGIGHPERFFGLLRRMGIEVLPHPFPDHHPYRPGDLAFEPPDLPVFMTAKDAVKCRRFAEERMWEIPLEVELDPRILETVRARLPAPSH
ncbi:MAG: tetraacyldisaccharide 4'-kinase [Gammaproteobacteria bacterium]|nr:MAG: tetraacyldisaccharide 4'-kinase [Gammaproteobacteria bacterium]